MLEAPIAAQPKEQAAGGQLLAEPWMNARLRPCSAAARYFSSSRLMKGASSEEKAS
jgi:hypothetical protein